MDTASWLLLSALCAIVWYWLNSLHALETARHAGKKLCDELDLQFLDDTVASIRVRLARNAAGRRVFHRTYRFEFSETGNSRREGYLILLGDRVESVTLEPYQMLP
ncbi:MAG TPA: DUF3301 domain-containing protein [Candidatus Paceibacterota bacterium]